MANINPVLSGIPQYLDESKEQLIAKTILGGDSVSMADLMSGVKGATAMHFLDTEIELGDASACGFEPNGSHTISQKVLTPAYLKVNQEFCPKVLLNTYAAHQLKIAAGQKNLPYEQDFLEGVSKRIQEAIEKMVWQGDSANGNECDGWLKIANADGANVISKAKGTSVYAAIKEGYLAVPEVAMKEDLTIFVSPAVFRNFVQELVALNLYHYDANDNALETVLPGTSVKVKAVYGLTNADPAKEIIFISRKSNLVYGCDMQSDNETFDFWFSQDSQTFKLAVEFMIGTQVKFGDEITIVELGK